MTGFLCPLPLNVTSEQLVVGVRPFHRTSPCHIRPIIYHSRELNSHLWCFLQHLESGIWFISQIEFKHNAISLSCQLGIRKVEYSESTFQNEVGRGREMDSRDLTKIRHPRLFARQPVTRLFKHCTWWLIVDSLGVRVRWVWYFIISERVWLWKLSGAPAIETRVDIVVGGSSSIIVFQGCSRKDDPSLYAAQRDSVIA